MRKAVVLVLIILVLAAAILLGRWMAADSGYVLVIRDNWDMDTTLGFVVLVAILAAAALIIATLLANLLWNLAEPVRATRRYTRHTARRRLKVGFIHLVDGKLDKAERLLSAAGEKGDWPLLGWLLAAEVAHEKRDGRRLDRYLRRAAEERRGELVSDLMRARFALEDQRPEEARQTLESLIRRAPKNKRILALYADVLERQQQWRDFCDLVPRLRKAFGKAEVADRERRAWLGRLHQLACESNVDATAQRRQLHHFWKALPSDLKRDPAMVARHAGFLAQSGDGRTALRRVRDQLAREWDDRLPPILEAIDDVPPDDLLSVLEGWLVDRPGNTAVLVTAGRVSLKAQLWGKAQNFFEAAASSGLSDTALAELARLYLALGDQSGAATALERRVQALSGNLPALPLPDHRAGAR